MNTNYLIAIGAATVLALGSFAGGWTISHWRDDARYQALIAEQANAAAEQYAKIQADLNRKAAESAELDRRYQSEKADAEKEMAALRSDIAAGKRKLRIKAKCSAGHMPGSAATTSGTDDTGLADIDPGASEKLLGITGRGDAEIRRLNALQEWLRVNLK